jgi:hypothetical protein
MSTAQRVSRGFHRLGLLLAANTLLVVGGSFTLVYLHAPNGGGSDWVAGMLIALFLSVAVYGVVRTIGWVVAGFAAS